MSLRGKEKRSIRQRVKALTRMGVNVKLAYKTVMSGGYYRYKPKGSRR